MNMAKIISMPFLFLCFLPCLFSFVKSQPKPLVPALYVFGDSILDAGNNNYLDTKAKSNSTPYGIDFPKGATGRFTNGYTIADFMATFLGISLTPPILGPRINSSKKPEGFNYASASAGILSETGESIKGVINLSLTEQIDLFNTTVREYLSAYFNNAQSIYHHVSKSIILVIIGNNDYGINYFLPGSNTSAKYNQQQFAELLVKELGDCLENLYMLGARRFVVGNVGPFGCKPKLGCDENQNKHALSFNEKLAKKLIDLRSKLMDSDFINLKHYKLYNDLLQNPARYGFTNSSEPCCMGPCVNTTPCGDRNAHFLWDAVHPSEAVYKIIATSCFNGTDLCQPVNILQLLQNDGTTTKVGGFVVFLQLALGFLITAHFLGL